MRLDQDDLAKAQSVMVAALKEVGIDTTAAHRTGVSWEFDHDPTLHWRAANLARAVVGIDEWPWEDWCHWHRKRGPRSARWLDQWGAP